MLLRDYQLETIEKTRDSIRSGNKRIIIQAGTGAGKTIIAASIIESALGKNKKVVFLVHLRQLAYQAKERFVEFGMGDEVGLIMAGEEPEHDRPVQIISVQTYGRRLKLNENLDENRWFKEADLVFYDECHSSIAKTRKAILDLYRDDAIIIGLSATPARADGRGLNKVYQDIVTCSNISDLTDLGFLAPAIYYGSKNLPDLKNIPTVAGDYNQKTLGERVNKPKLVGDILENFLRIAPERQCVVFATNVKHSKYIRDTFRAHGISIEHIDGRTPDDDRKDILRRFKDGDVQVVTNCAVFQEGADFGWADCVILAKPSKSLPRYFQMAGRGLRPYPGKDNVIIIDHSRLVEAHGFLDSDIEWSLGGKEKAWKRKTVVKKEKEPMSCDECNFLFVGKKCPQCGTEIKDYGKKIAAMEADLVEIGKVKLPKATMEDKKKFYGMLEYQRRLKGYKKGWVSHKFKEKFKTWPRGLDGTGPIEPDATFNSWLRYLNIKWAKSKRKRETKEEVRKKHEQNPLFGLYGVMS